MIVKTLSLLFATFIGVILSEVTDEPWQSESSTSSYNGPPWALRVQTRFFREKCEKNGLSDAFFEVEKAIKEAHVCYRSAMYNMEKPRPEHTKSESDYVIYNIKGYCAKTPELEECYDLLAEGVLPCLTAEEKHQLDSWLDAWHQLLEFICFKEAERPSRFISDGGLACMDTHKNELKECTDGLIDILERWTPEIIMMDSAFEEIQEEQCAKITTLKDCVLTTLDRCGRPTITDFAVSVLDIMIKGMPCEELEAIRDVRACYRRFWDIKRSKSGLNNRRSDYKKSGTQSPRFCDEMQTLWECYDLLMTGVRPCLTDSESRQVDNWLDARHQLFEFICSNQGQTMSRFEADGGWNFMEVNYNKLKECTDGSEELLFRSVPELPITTFDEVKHINFDEVQEGQCTKVMALKDCLMATFRRHGRPTVAETANSVIDILIGGAPCKVLMAP